MDPKIFEDKAKHLMDLWCHHCTSKYIKRKSKITIEIFLAMLIDMDSITSTSQATFNLSQLFHRSAFSKFRVKIPHEELKLLLKQFINMLIQEKILPSGAMIVAGDASTVELDDSFESLGFKRDKPNSPIVGLLTALVEIETGIPIALDFSRSKDERAAILRLLPELPIGSLIILDRGYLSEDLIHQIQSKGLDVICRATRNLKIVKNRNKCSCDQKVLFGEPKSSVPVRLITYLASGNPNIIDGNVIYLVTTLDVIQPLKRITMLYGKRWAIEEFFKFFKETIGINNFHSRSENGVLQQLNIGAFKVAYLRALEIFSSRILVTRDEFKEKINSKVSNSLVNRSLISMILPGSYPFLSSEFILKTFRKNILSHRKFRSFPRKTKRGKTKKKYNPHTSKLRNPNKDLDLLDNYIDFNKLEDIITLKALLETQISN